LLLNFVKYMWAKNKEISLSKFILQYIILQIAFFTLVISIFCFCKYLSWKTDYKNEKYFGFMDKFNNLTTSNIKYLVAKKRKKSRFVG
jgi:ABC-type multidrug transport system permease subunit